MTTKTATSKLAPSLSSNALYGQRRFCSHFAARTSGAGKSVCRPEEIKRDFRWAREWACEWASLKVAAWRAGVSSHAQVRCDKMSHAWSGRCTRCLLSFDVA